MSTAQTWQTESTCLDDTLKLGEQIGLKLRGGEVIELMSDLGGGKTAFVRGLARGLGSTDHVHSPSFTLSNQYRGNKLTLHHLDFYRLDEPGLMSNELAELLNDQQAVVAVEWAGLVEDVLPVNRLSIIIKVTGETSRQLSFRYSQSLNYLSPGNTIN